MPKTTYDAALQASTGRRGWGVNTLSNVTAAATVLAQAAATIHTGGTNSTTAVGLFRNAWLLVAKQGSNPNAAAIRDTNIASWVGQQLALQTTPALLVVNDSYPTQTGFHAEMMIIRYVVVGAQVTKAALQNELIIGVTKGCCRDCAGFLNKYHVPHNVPVDALSNPVEPTPTDQWMHPTSGALYAGGATLETYRHPGSTKTLSRLDDFEYY
jgi:hypothetical protein